MADKTMPTPGEWTVTSQCTVLVPYRLTVHMTLNGEWAGEKEANARLIAAAGTAASEVADMGYDPVEALVRWPKLLEAASALLADIDTCGHPVDPAYRDWLADELERAAGKEGDDGNR